MIDERFSAAAFAAAALQPDGPRGLTILLQDEIEAELARHLKPRFAQIIGHLNEAGHSLRLHGEPDSISVDYRDDEYCEDRYVCRLRVGITFFATAAYGIDESTVDD